MFFCGSFTKPIRIEIKERANERSELSGENSRPLVCAHIIHRGNKKGRFDYSENGLLVTDIEHLAHHRLFEQNPRKIGLSKEQNNLSIFSLTRDVEKYNEGNDISKEETQEKFEDAIKSWIELFDNDHRILGVSKKQNRDIITNLIRDINEKAI